MATRTGYVSTESIGDVLTKANFDKLPGGMIGYAQITTTSANFASSASLQGYGLSLNVTAGTTRILEISTFAPFFNILTFTTQVELNITQASVSIASVYCGQFSAPGAVPGNNVTTYAMPSAGSVTFAAALLVTSSGGGTANVAATAVGASTHTANLLVRDAGPAF